MLKTIIKDPKKYLKTGVLSDLKAALSVTVLLIPQGMAYALLTGVPPIYGLYASLVPMLIYPLFGSSRYLSIGPVALMSIIVFSGLSLIAEPMTPEYIALAILTSMLAGLFQIIFSALRMGFLVNFLSGPVLSGFISAAAVIIAASQLKHIFGLTYNSRGNLVSILGSFFNNISAYNVYAIIIGVTTVVLILLIKRIKKSLPVGVFVVVLGIVWVILSGWDKQGLAILGEVPSGLPSFYLPELSWETIQKVIPLSLVVALISFIESLAIAKSIAAKKSDFDVDPNKELMGLGLAKVIGGFFQSFPNTGSFSRSVINEQAGAKTGMSSIFSGLMVGLTLLFFTGLFYSLPKATLAAIVFAAVIGIIDYKRAIFLYKTHRRDFLVLMTTFVLTLVFGVQQGVVVGVVLSIILIMGRVSKPHYAVLGEIGDTKVYRNIKRFEDAKVNDNIMIFRYDEDIFFGNAQHFFDAVITEVRKRKELKKIVLDFSAVSNMDSTGYVQFKSLVGVLRDMNIVVQLINVKGPVRDFFKINNVSEFIDPEHYHLGIKQALADLEGVESENNQ